MKLHPRGSHNAPSRAFTLIELLVVIAIIAILAVVVVLTLNPAQLLAQSRDANRVSDMATLSSAINLYQTDQSGASSYSLGNSSTSYISVPSSATSCSTLGMASSAYAWACSASYRNTNATGWVPINFSNISAGAPFGSLPVDPVNQTSSNLYYAYETNGSTYALSAFMESQKYAKNMASTGGIDPAVYQIGSGVASLPDATRGLVGYWPLNEGTGITAVDWSGYGNNGAWQGNQTGTSGYYSPGHVWQWAGAFDGSSTYINAGNAASLNVGAGDFTAMAWLYTLYNPPYDTEYFLQHSNLNSGWVLAVVSNSTLHLEARDSPNSQTFNWSTLGGYENAWHQFAIVKTIASITAYEDGVSLGTQALSYANLSNASVNFHIGYLDWWSPGFFNGYIQDVRVYDRALSAAEIQELYNAEK